jgi:hypothetical protein
MSTQSEIADHAPSPSKFFPLLPHTQYSNRSQDSRLRTVHLVGIVDGFCGESGTSGTACTLLLERVSVRDHAGKEISSMLELRGPFANRTEILALLGIREGQSPTPSVGSIEGQKVHAYKRGSLPAATKRKDNSKTCAPRSLA